MTSSRSEEISVDTCAVVVSDQITSQLGDESVVLGLKDGIYYGLDPIGTRIWGLLDCPRTVRQICDVIQSEYEVGTSECEKAVLALMRDLHARALIEVRC